MTPRRENDRMQTGKQRETMMRQERRPIAAMVILGTLLLLGAVTEVAAQIPRIFSWQGVLLDQFRAPVADGSYRVTIRLYDVASGGMPIWEESDDVTTFDGVFTTILGDGTPLALPFDAPYWLAVELQSEPEMTPRIPLVSLPYALNALRATEATTADRARIADSIAGGFDRGVTSLNGRKGDLHLVGRGGTTVGLSGDTVIITSGGQQLPPNAAEGDIVRFDATANRWVTASITVATSPRISGDGSAGAPLDIAAMGAADRSVLQFDATSGTWRPGTIAFSVATKGPLGGDGSTGDPLGLVDGTIRGQGLFWNGTNWSLSAAQPPSAGDALRWDATNQTWSPGPTTVTTTDRLTGDGTTTRPLDIAAMGAGDGQSLVWDSTATRWRPGSPFLISRPPFTGSGTQAAPLAMAPGTRTGQILYWDGSIWRVASGPDATTNDILTWDPTLGWRPQSFAVEARAALTQGSLWVGGANDSAAVLPTGSANNVLAMRPDGSAPVWTNSLRIDSLDVDALRVRSDGRIDGNLTVSGTDVTLPDGTIDNRELADSTIRIIYGSGLDGDAVVALGGSLNLRNSGVLAIAPGNGILVDSTTGTVTVTNGGVTRAVAGRGIGVDSATGNVTFTNSGVVATRAGRGIAVDSTTGIVTVTNNGVVEARAGRGITLDSATGIVTIASNALLGARAGTGIDVTVVNDSATITNTGVTILRGTTDQIITSDSTGAITLSLPQDIDTDATPTFDGLTLGNLNTASTASDIVVSNSGIIESRPFTSLLPGGLLPVGATTNSTLRWNGSSWVENGTIQGDSLGNLASDGSATIGGNLAVNGTNVDLPNGSIDNRELADSTIRIVYGSGLDGDTIVSLGGSLNLRNSGVQAIAAGDGILVDSTTGTVTVTNDGVTRAIAGRGIAVDSATGNVTFTNSGVVATQAGRGIAVDSTTGIVTVTNSGVIEARAGRGIALDSATGIVTIASNALLGARAGTGIDVTVVNDSATIANTGVTVLRGTTNQVVTSDSTGTVTLSLPQDIDSTATPTFTGLHLINLDTTSTATNLLVSNGSRIEARTLASITDSLGNGFWRAVGNAGTDPSANFIGTTDSTTLVVRVNNDTIYRLIPGSTPSIIGGPASNNLFGGPIGALIGGGSENRLDSAADHSVVGGGSANRIDTAASISVIAGGRLNTIGARSNRSVIAGGAVNRIEVDAAIASILGGQENRIGTGSFGSGIVSGYRDSITGTSGYAILGGGERNRIDSSAWSVLGGGLDNKIGARSILATISGGEKNRIDWSGRWATIGGGRTNTIDSTADYFTIAGGQSNRGGYGAWHSAIGGGQGNRITARALASTIVGGRDNTIDSADHSTILGGRGLTIHSDNSLGFHADDGTKPMSIDNPNAVVFGNASIWLANNDGVPSPLLFYEPNTDTGAFPGTTNYTAFEAAAQGADISYILPDTAGAAGDVLTVKDATGIRITLDWTSTGGSNGWLLSGNAGTDPANDFIGTVDNQPLVIRVDNDTVMRYVPHTNGPMIIGGHRSNNIGVESWSSTISGGGGGALANSIGRQHPYGTIGGGGRNRLGDTALYGTIGGGFDNVASPQADYATIGGGGENEIRRKAIYTHIGGGFGNIVSDSSAYVSIGGGSSNIIHDSVSYATISGGRSNVVSQRGSYSTIAGGSSNQVLAETDGAVIGGGASNDIEDSAHYSVIGGGTANTVRPNATYNVIGGGFDNEIEASANHSTIAGGKWHLIHEEAEFNAIGGGRSNEIEDSTSYSTIGGGLNNHIQPYATYSTIAGGVANHIGEWGDRGTIAGGNLNTIWDSTLAGTIGGGIDNNIRRHSLSSTVGGGQQNDINIGTSHSTIGGGLANRIIDNTASATIGGGDTNLISAGASHSTIGGGQGNTIADTSFYSTIGGGHRNHIDRYVDGATIAGGVRDTIGQNADNSAILGGFGNKIDDQVNGSAIVGGAGLTLTGSRTFGFHANAIFGGKDMEISDGFSAVFGNVDLWLANNNNTTSALRFYEAYNTSGAFPGPAATRAYFTSFQAPALTDTIRYILPATKGTAGDVMEISAVNGDEITLEWDTDDDSSDERFKHNIRRLTGALDSTLMLRGVRHDWRHDDFEDRHFPETESIGFIAQEVEAIFPELVETENDGYKKVRYAKVTALLVEALREQQADIETQDARIDEQTAEIAELRRMIEMLIERQNNADRTRVTTPDAR